ncbi:MAG TPA: ABC transporter ATP-binding protein [Candidatus Acidoferrales bacterium]|nr:ABC transporter ATP-binding protein [Candidatus Acidoferrales bacterium]
MLQGNENIFEIQNVSYTYSGHHSALNDISMIVKSGESISILGANGSGKSTLLKLLCGLIFPTSGAVKAFGSILSEAGMELNRSEFARYFRRRVGMVFQDADSQLFSPVVWEEVAFAPLQLNLPEGNVQLRVKEALSLLGIQHLRNRSSQNLSEGEKRKVALASVLALGPDVLLLDEPSSDLDPRTKVWLESFLNELHETGKTIITATHDLELAADTSDRCIVLDEQHRMAADGSTDETLSNWNLLLNSNLAHVHAHKHGQVFHTHPHAHTE